MCNRQSATKEDNIIDCETSQGFQHPARHAGLKLDHHPAKLSYFMSFAANSELGMYVVHFHPKTKTALLIRFD
jgi:hypothetical protein